MKETPRKGCKCKCDLSQLPLSERIGFQIFQLSWAFRSRKNKDFEAIDLTSSQADVLMYVYRHENEQNVQQVDIERQFSLSNPTVTGIIQRLESKGFLTREVSPNDKRCKFLHCTQQAKQIYDYTNKMRKESNELLVQNFTEEEKEELSRLLGKAIENMRRQNDSED